MAEYNLVCLVCEHSPHRGTGCKEFKCPCQAFVRPDIRMAQAISNLNNVVVDVLPRLELVISNLADLMTYAFPEAWEKMKKDRQEALEAQQAAALEKKLGPVPPGWGEKVDNGDNRSQELEQVVRESEPDREEVRPSLGETE